MSKSNSKPNPATNERLLPPQRKRVGTGIPLPLKKSKYLLVLRHRAYTKVRGEEINKWHHTAPVVVMVTASESRLSNVEESVS